MYGDGLNQYYRNMVLLHGKKGHSITIISDPAPSRRGHNNILLSVRYNNDSYYNKTTKARTIQQTPSFDQYGNTTNNAIIPALIPIMMTTTAIVRQPNISFLTDPSHTKKKKNGNVTLKGNATLDTTIRTTVGYHDAHPKKDVVEKQKRQHERRQQRPERQRHLSPPYLSSSFSCRRLLLQQHDWSYIIEVDDESNEEDDGINHSKKLSRLRWQSQLPNMASLYHMNNKKESEPTLLSRYSNSIIVHSDDHSVGKRRVGATTSSSSSLPPIPIRRSFISFPCG
jgi:hypothetical protein